MSIDVNSVHNIATAIAERNRDENNRGKKVNQEGWKTREQARKEAAQLTMGILAYTLVFKFLWKGLCALGRLNRKIFGEKIGKVINIGFVFMLLLIPCCVLFSDGSRVADNHQSGQERAVAAIQRRNIENVKMMHGEMIAEFMEKEKVSSQLQVEAIAVFERESNIDAMADLTEEMAKERILKAYQKCLRFLSENAKRKEKVSVSGNLSIKRPARENRQFKSDDPTNDDARAELSNVSERKENSGRQVEKHHADLKSKIMQIADPLTKKFKKEGHYDVALHIEALVRRFDDKTHWIVQSAGTHSYEDTVKSLKQKYQESINEINVVVRRAEQKQGGKICR